MKLKNVFKSLNCKHSNGFIFVRNIYGDEINQLGGARSMWICPDCNKIVYTDDLYDIGNLSDGYHTFNELYHHRAILFANICHAYKDRCWKSLKHSDGTMYDGMFIVGIVTPNGIATYHYDAKYWDLFNIEELPVAPMWDGHTSEDAIERIKSLLKYHPKELMNFKTATVSIEPPVSVVESASISNAHTYKKSKNSLFKKFFNFLK